jgi:DUF4097 and DUF4098 domain-containing protein YvlB
MPTFDTPKPISATIEIVLGDVRITATDRQDTVVEVRPSDPTSEVDARIADQTRVEYADGRLLVKAPKPRTLGLFGKPGSVDVEIALPTGSDVSADAGVAAFHGIGVLGSCRIRSGTGDVRLDRTGPVELTTASGAIAVAAVAGDAALTTASGELRVGEITGDAVVKNSNGDVRIGSVTGTLTVKAANGDVVVEHAGADLTAATSNGNVRITEITRGSVSVKTGLGELEVGIPAGTAAYLDLHTQFGNVHNRLDAVDAPTDRERTVHVRARTGYGDIVIRRP